MAKEGGVEWDNANNPSSAQGYTVIFDEVRDDKNTTKSNPTQQHQHQPQPPAVDHPDNYNNDSPTFNKNQPYHPPDSSRKLKWLCCG
ncbi:hypothetical protein LINGRAHAP2_LOCUS812 [Linum grandiflorum]